MHPSATPPKIVSLWISILLVAWSSGCARPPSVDPASRTAEDASIGGPQSECQPSFPDVGGWYGGDAAYSVALPTDGGRVSLWLFGDSFVRRPGGPEARSYPFVHNTIGLSRCRPGGDWQIEIAWRRDAKGQPIAFFEPDPDAEWVRRAEALSEGQVYYWPMDGFLVDDVLFVGLLRVVPSAARGPFNLPFRLAGLDLARIENYTDAPTDWRVRLSTLSDDSGAFPGSSFVASERFIYAFAFLDDEGAGSPRILTRFDRSALARWQPDLSGSFETLTAPGRWTRGFAPQDALILMDDDASEMSVHFDAPTREWRAVYTPLAPRGPAMSPTDLVIRRAASLEGPWSDPETLAPVPETLPPHPRSLDPNLFCYAGKAHPQFSKPDALTLTYVCNLFAREPDEVIGILHRLLESVDLYRPRALSIDAAKQP